MKKTRTDPGSANAAARAIEPKGTNTTVAGSHARNHPPASSSGGDDTASEGDPETAAPGKDQPDEGPPEVAPAILTPDHDQPRNWTGSDSRTGSSDQLAGVAEPPTVDPVTTDSIGPRMIAETLSQKKSDQKQRALGVVRKARRAEFAKHLVGPKFKDGFLRDATAWDLLRPVALGILRSSLVAGHLANLPPTGVAAGRLAPSVVDLARAKDPLQWTRCATCQESGDRPSGEQPCGACSGVGYRIELEDDATIARMIAWSDPSRSSSGPAWAV